MSIINKERIESEVKKIVQEEGFELIDLKVFLNRGSYTLRCIVDSVDGGITMDDCAKINKKVFHYLEDNRIIGDDYAVEVNSPGLDRPLKNQKDFLRVKGREVSLWFKEFVCDKSSLEGEVLDSNENELLLKYKGEVLKINFNNIKIGKEKIKVS